MQSTLAAADNAGPIGPTGMSLTGALRLLARHRRLLVAGPLVAGALAVGLTFVLPAVFTARTSFLPPQQQQSSAAANLAALGALAGLPATALKSPADQYVALMQSETVANRMIDRFGLMQVYESKFRVDARKELAKNAQFVVGKKDGLITVWVDDHQPQRAAAMADAFVEELRHMTNGLALSEAQQRRVFFERELQRTKAALAQAQAALQSSGFTSSALKAEPKATAEGYARLEAELTAAEVRLQAMRSTFNEGAAELRQQENAVAALKERLARAERPAAGQQGPDYVSKYREYKYQETLFDLFARQYELARADESREGALIQVVDKALVPERRSWPQRKLFFLGGFFAALLILAAGLLLRNGSNSAVTSGPAKA